MPPCYAVVPLRQWSGRAAESCQGSSSLSRSSPGCAAEAPAAAQPWQQCRHNITAVPAASGCMPGLCAECTAQLATAQAAILKTQPLSGQFKAHCSRSRHHQLLATAQVTHLSPLPKRCPTDAAMPHTLSDSNHRPRRPGHSQLCLPHKTPIPVQGPYREHFQLLQKEVAILHILGSHPHILGLREVLHADERLYLVTGGGAWGVALCSDQCILTCTGRSFCDCPLMRGLEEAKTRWRCTNLLSRMLSCQGP